MIKMNIGCNIGLAFIALVIRSAHPQSSVVFVNRVCKQCLSWCPKNSTLGPAGFKGEAGHSGGRGRRGSSVWKGGIGTPGVSNNSVVVKLIDRKLQQAFHGLPLDHESPYRACSDVREHWVPGYRVTSGLVDLSIPVIGETEAYCDFTSDGGDWIVFQRRTDGVESFYRKWEDYVKGFGEDREHEFWLGLEALHQLTSQGRWEMRIDMTSVDSVRYYAKYRRFYIGPASDSYRLTIGGHSGDIPDAMQREHGNRLFSTWDADHDYNPKQNCAIKWHGAWWYDCRDNVHSNLNGLHRLRRYYGMSWYGGSEGWYYMNSTEMKIRQRK